MKRLLLVLVGTGLVLPGFVYAGDPSPWPPLGTETEVFELIDAAWMSWGLGNPAAKTRAFISRPVSYSGSMEQINILFENHASVAQFTQWAMTGGPVGNAISTVEQLINSTQFA